MNEIICEKDEIYRIEMLQKLFKQGLITKEILNFSEDEQKTLEQQLLSENIQVFFP